MDYVISEKCEDEDEKEIDSKNLREGLMTSLIMEMRMRTTMKKTKMGW